MTPKTIHRHIAFKLQKIKDEENLKTQKVVRGKTPYHEGSKIRYTLNFLETMETGRVE